MHHFTKTGSGQNIGKSQKRVKHTRCVLNSVFEHLHLQPVAKKLKTITLYQDRLGTSIGNVEGNKQKPFFVPCRPPRRRPSQRYPSPQIRIWATSLSLLDRAARACWWQPSGGRQQCRRKSGPLCCRQTLRVVRPTDLCQTRLWTVIISRL